MPKTTETERDESLLTIAEAATRLSISVSGLRKLIKEDPNFPVVNLGDRMTRVRSHDLNRYIAQLAAPGAGR